MSKKLLNIEWNLCRNMKFEWFWFGITQIRRKNVRDSSRKYNINADFDPENITINNNTNRERKAERRKGFTPIRPEALSFIWNTAYSVKIGTTEWSFTIRKLAADTLRTKCEWWNMCYSDICYDCGFCHRQSIVQRQSQKERIRAKTSITK